MKWYKKQLDALKKQTSADTSKNSGGQQFADIRKTSPHTRFRNPVAQRNRNRNKTDSKPTGK